ncbi:MAG: carbohydrate-binding domain-containing protein [Ignavibacteriales bacterium]|nr:carbohydrate-binding domain-containing protein [Ignavibacteriales bacterium]
MVYKKPILFFVFALAISILTGCKSETATEPNITETQTTTSGGGASVGSSGKTLTEVLAANKQDHEAAEDYIWNSSDIIPIVLSGTTITASGNGVSISGSTVTITSGGTYSISGTLTNGQINVNSSDAKTVRLILSGVNITNTTGAPINVMASEKTVIVLADNTQNFVTDASTYVFANTGDDEPNAAIFSKGDLSFYGNGTLTVKANYNDAISCKDGLIIKSGTLNVSSVDDGIRGKDYLIVKSGNITVNAKGDGLKSDNDEDSTRGYIYIANSSMNIISGGDAITAQTDVLISDGTYTITSGGGSGFTANTTNSSKGIKGLVYTIISGGTYTLSTADDALHSNKNLVINGGTFAITSGDDGIHADASLIINNGTINITKSYEGIESAALIINGGEIHIVSSDDGLNGAGGRDASSPGSFVQTGNYYLYINGGYIFINATGDGIDINGSIVMTDGVVVVNGPTANMNGAIDYDASFKISGGFIVASGSSGMAQAPGTTSAQYSVLVTFKTTLSANTLFHIQNSSGSDILSFVPKKNYQSVAISSPKLAKGTYDIYYGGTSTGMLKDGLYQDGIYSAGTKATSFTISSIVTKVSF